MFRHLPNSLAYLAAPYSHVDPDVTEERMKTYCLCDAALMAAGQLTCSPLLKHLVRSHVAEMPGDWEFWGNYSKKLLSKCDFMIVIMMDGWKESTGVQAEIEYANKVLKIEVIYYEPKYILNGLKIS